MFAAFFAFVRVQQMGPISGQTLGRPNWRLDAKAKKVE